METSKIVNATSNKVENSKSETDWINEWFRARRDCGEDISILFGQVKANNSDKTKPDWFEMPHDEFDGIGALVHLLRSQGFSIEQLPVLQNDRYTTFRMLRGLLAFLPTSNVRRQKWRSFDKSLNNNILPVGERVVSHLFSDEQTKKMISITKAANVTLNTYLLYHLDAVVASQLTDASASRRWMIAVNLRGAITRPTELTNHLSFLAVDLVRDFSLGQLYDKINRLKKRGYHWAAWASLKGGGSMFGAEGMRRYLRTREKKGHGWTGTFSNLGAWNIPGSGNWFFCPNVSRSFPVGAGCITMNGRLAIALQLHEDFGPDTKTRQALLDAWKRNCLGE